MKFGRITGLFTALVLVGSLIACGTNNEGVTPMPDRDISQAFSVTRLDDASRYQPELAVSETVSAVTVTMSAVDSADLTAVAVHLNYDAAAYTPRSVEFLDFLGAGSETLTLALTHKAGYVPVGVTQITSSGVTPRNGSGDIARVVFDKSPATGLRTASYHTPVLAANKVDDLQIIQMGEGTVDLYWTEVNVGDTDNNGLVVVSDLTAIGQNFNAVVAESEDPERVALVDCNSNGLVEVSDITPIGQNYENQVSGYKLYTDAEGTVEYGDGITIERETAKTHQDNVDEPLHAVKYYFTADLPGGMVEFTVRPVCASDAGTVGRLSNATEGFDELPPDPPSEVTAVSDAGIGHKKVVISWTASPSTDVREYIVERQLDSVPDVWAEAGSVSGDFTSMMDDDPLFAEEPYTYRVKAVDFTDRESDFVMSGSVTPFVFFVPAPLNVAVDNILPTPLAIKVTWEAPADDSGVSFYRVYDAGTHEILLATASKYVYEYTHSGLTEGVTYNFYVTSVAVGGSAESEPSNTAGTTPSEFIEEVNITSFNTDKTTHCYAANESPANLTVVTDMPPSSVDWSVTGGTVTGTGASVTWMPTTYMTPQKVTVTVTVHRGAGNDSATLDLYVTQAGILTGFGNTGHYIDFNGEFLEALSEGGSVIPNTQFSSLATRDHVIVMNRWESS